jgi:hypothetical protein
MNIADMDHEADVAVGIDRIGQQLGLVEQVLAVGPIAENGDCQFVVITAIAIVGNCWSVGDECRRKQASP